MEERKADVLLLLFEISTNVHRGFNSNAGELEHWSGNLNMKNWRISDSNQEIDSNFYLHLLLAWSPPTAMSGVHLFYALVPVGQTTDMQQK